MQIKVLVCVLWILLLCSTITVSAQQYDKEKTAGKPDAQLSQKDNDIDRQDKVFLYNIRAILSKYPPSVPEHRQRNMAKLLMDAVFHDAFAVYRSPVQQFFRQRVDQVIKELETTKVEKGAQIWKVYNIGFIARTKIVTIAFDLVTGINRGRFYLWSLRRLYF